MTSAKISDRAVNARERAGGDDADVSVPYNKRGSWPDSRCDDLIAEESPGSAGQGAR